MWKPAGKWGKKVEPKFEEQAKRESDGIEPSVNVCR